jgi:hypothetical protein
MASRKSSRAGSTMVEFVLSVAFIFAPLILGTIVIGMNIIRNVQLTQLNRDAGHMFARGVNFGASSGASNQAMLQFLGTGLNLSASGKSVEILTCIMKVPSTCGCTNAGKAVLTKQVIIGNTGFGAKSQSKFYSGAPPASLVDADGNVKTNSSTGVPYYMTDARLQTVGFDGTVMALDDNELAYVAEAYYRSSELDLPGFMTGTGVTARGIF